MPMTQNERKFRDILDSEYKQLFQQYEEMGGMPMSILLEELSKNPKITKLPAKSVKQFSESVTDPDQRITYYDFFIQMMHANSNQFRLSPLERQLNRAMLAIDPQRRYRPVPIRGNEADAFLSSSRPVEEEMHFVKFYDCRPPPLFIPLITLIEIVFFALTNISQFPYGEDINLSLRYDPRRRHELWRFITYTMLHSNIVHLLFNVFVQLVLGVWLEFAHKFYRVACIYFLGIVSGSLFPTLFKSQLLVGASGGVYALIGAHLSNVFLNWQEMQNNWLDGPINFISSAVFQLTVMLLLIVTDTLQTAYNEFISVDPTNSGKNISVSAHVGGLLTGALVGIVVLRNGKIHNWEVVAGRICLGIYLLMVTMIVIYNLVECLAKVQICYT